MGGEIVVDENFKGAGKKVGLEIWRIKQFKVLPLDKNEYGTFYSGDSYIVLKTDENQEWNVHFWLGKNTTQTYEDDDADGITKIYHNVHFWIGKNTSQDEMGTAAIKTVELDEALGGGPVQYREVQNFESAQFVSYFKQGLKYMDGGYESGFFKIEDLVEKPRLFQCKGKRNVRVNQVPLKVESLNKGDVFILDAGEKILVWTPPKAGRLERVRAIQQATNIRDAEHAGRGDIHILDENWDSSAAFWDHFGGLDALAKVKTAAEGGNDEGHWLKEKAIVSLYRVSDASGKVEIDKVASGDVKMDQLDSKDAFILDAVSGGIFVWIGTKCTLTERKKAMAYAQEYIERMKRPKHTQVVRVLETAEPRMFTQWFAQVNKSAVRSRARSVRDPVIDVQKKPKPRLYEVSDESGAMTVEEVENFTQEALDGDDVMLLDALDTIYVWIGDGANDNERKHAEDAAKKYLSLDAVKRPHAAKVVVCKQNQETQDFKKLFPSWSSKVFAENGVKEVKRRILTATDVFF